MKSVVFNKNFLLSGDSSFSRRGNMSESIEQKGISFFSMIRDVAQNENGRLTPRLSEKDTASFLKSATRSNNLVDSLNSPIEMVRRAFLAKGVPLDQVVLDKNDFESLRTILDKLDFPRTSIDNFFQQMVHDNPGRKTTLSDFFKDLTQFEKEFNATSSPRVGDAQTLYLDKSIVPHIESSLRDLGVAPEILDSILPSVSDVDGNVDLKKLVHQLKKIQSSSISPDAPEASRNHDVVLTPQLVEAMETMGLPKPRQSIGAAFSLDNLIGIMETKLESVSLVSPKLDPQDSIVLDEVSEISEKQSMDNGQVDSFFAFAEAMMVRQNFETRRNLQEYTLTGELNSTGAPLFLLESGATVGVSSAKRVSISSDYVDDFPDFGNVISHAERHSSDPWNQTEERSVLGDGIRVDLDDGPGALPDDAQLKTDIVYVQISEKIQINTDVFVHLDPSIESNTVSTGLAESAVGRMSAGEFQIFDSNRKANSVNLQSDRQKNQTNEVGIFVTDKANPHAGNGEFKDSAQVLYPRDARDALQERDNFQSVLRADNFDSPKSWPPQSQSPPNDVAGVKSGTVVSEAWANYQKLVTPPGADDVAPVLRKSGSLESQGHLAQKHTHEDGGVQSNSVASDFPKNPLNAEKISMDLPQASMAKSLAGEFKVSADVHKVAAVNIDSPGQRFQTHTGGSVLTNKAVFQSDNGEFKFPDQMIQPGNVTDINQEGKGFHSPILTLKSDSATSHPSQPASNPASVGKDGVVTLELTPYPQGPVTLRTGEESSPHFKNMASQDPHFYGSVLKEDDPSNSAVQSNIGISPSLRERSHDVSTFKLSDPMLRTGDIPEMHMERSSLQAMHGTDRSHRSSKPIFSTSQSMSNFTQSLSKDHVELPRESLPTVPDTGMVEMAVPDQLLTQQNVLRELKGNKYSLGNRFSLPWNKTDMSGMESQLMTELNAPSQNGNMGISEAIDGLIDDILSGTRNPEAKFITSSAQKGINFEAPGGFERLSMATQSNASTVPFFSQKENTSGTVFPPNVVETVGKEIAAFLQRGERMLRIQLKPAELGTVNIEMDTKENVIKLSIVPETSSARELFLSNHNELRRVLEGHGIRLENLEIQMNDGFAQSMANGDHQSARQRNQRWGTRFARMGKREDGADSISPMGQNKDSLLDLLV